MRCYFIRNGHFAAVEVLNARADEDAIEQAQSLFEQHAKSFDGFELWEGGRLVYQFPEVSPPCQSAPTDVQSYYRLYLLGEDDIIRGYFDFLEDSDDAAFAIAAAAFDACADRATQFEVWHNARRIDPPAPAVLATLDQVIAGHQGQVVALEERMRDSRWAVSTSKRLLARLKGLRRPLASANHQAVI